MGKYVQRNQIQDIPPIIISYSPEAPSASSSDEEGMSRTSAPENNGQIIEYLVSLMMCFKSRTTG